MTTSAHGQLFGRPRWQITLAVVFIAQMLTSAGFAVVYPFTPLYVKDLGSTLGLSVEMGAGLALGIQGFTMMLLSPIWGVVADRYGRKLMVMRAMFGGTLIMFLMAFARSAEELILLRAIQGTITGTIGAHNALVAAETPRERIGFAMGTLQVGLWGGVALGPLVGGVLSDLYGFRMPFVITSISLFCAGLLVFFFIKEDFQPLEQPANTKRPNVIAQWRHVLAAKGVSLVYIVSFLGSIGRSMIVPIAPLFVVSLLDPAITHQSIYAGMVSSVSSFTSTFSSIYLGRLGDRIGHRQILIACALFAAVFYLPQVFVMDVWQLLFLQGLTGLAIGGMISAPNALLAVYTQRGEEGVVYGIENATSSGARAVAPLIGSSVAVLFGMRSMFVAIALIFVFIAFVTYRLLPSAKRTALAPATGD